MNSENAVNWALVIFLIAATIGLLVMAYDTANAAESAIVSFRDAEHLAALQDSVVGVCDTVINKTEVREYGYWRDNGEGMGSWIRSDTSSYSEVFPTLTWTTITCRQLVGVTKMKDAEERLVDRRGILIQVGHPGEAIIWFEEVKQ